ncbi:MAG: NifB/NifX family molybdenum-iron cluster-binding protein [Candidatus Izemoplasmatales bacterium]|jgi:predicted Fe-Mo cluster-binding NifX family protein
MIIALPTLGNTLDSPVSPQFGRTPYFCLYDLESDSVRFIRNDATESQGGAGVKAADLIVNMGVEILIAQNVGEKALHVFRQSGIEIYVSRANHITLDIERYKSGKLTKIISSNPQ